ncbi:MAG: hypothetical protein ACJAVV_001041 [Alphaproteobacteria bacterium]|jgi:hypothetical protein
MTQRKPLARHAIAESQYSPLWEQAQFGDGGYALGARQQQIMTLLMQ